MATRPTFRDYLSGDTSLRGNPSFIDILTGRARGTLQGPRESRAPQDRLNAGPGRGGPIGSGRGQSLPQGTLDTVGRWAEGLKRPGQKPPGTEAGPPQQSTLDQVLAMLAGEGGGGVDTGALASSFDKEIAALRGGGQKIAGLTDQLIGNIGSSASAAQGQIGGFFGYAGEQARAGRPVIAESGRVAQENIGANYDELASQIAGLPQSTADAARAAGGQAAGSSVADRVAVAAAPFAAAGEGARAASLSNVATHTTAGQDYLTQLAAAAPSEAAMAQSAVAGRANQAVTNAQMQLAAQQAEIEARAASIEGSKQRALLEATADTAGSTAEQMMQAIGIVSGLQDIGAAPPGEFSQDAAYHVGSTKDSLQLQKLVNSINLQERQLNPEAVWEQSLEEATGGQSAYAERLRALSEENPEYATLIPEALGAMTNKPPEVREPGFFGRLFGKGPEEVDNTTAKTLDELVEQILSGEVEDPSFRTGVDPDEVRRLMRRGLG